jgi:hypothetical protein
VAGKRIKPRPRPVGPVLSLVGAQSLEQLEADSRRDAVLNRPTGPRPRIVDTSTAKYADVSAPCWLCGGAVTAAAAVYLDTSGWRSHPEHALRGDAAIAGLILAGVLGRRFDTSLTDADAELLLRDGRLPMPYERVAVDNLTPVEPWSHVSRSQRRDVTHAILDRLPMLRSRAAGTALVTCEDGPCGMCGTIAARGWVTFPGSPVWPAGGVVPFCDRCARAHHDTSIDDTTWDGYARSTIRACTGVLVHPHEVRRFYLPPFARDHDRTDPAAGQPWAYLDADKLRDLRLTLYLMQSPANSQVPAPWRAIVAQERAHQEAARRTLTSDTADQALALAQLAAARTGGQSAVSDPVRGWFT